MGRCLVVLGVVLAGCGGGEDDFQSTKGNVIDLHWECYQPVVDRVGNLEIDESDAAVCAMCVGARTGLASTQERYPSFNAESGACIAMVDECEAFVSLCWPEEN